MTATYAALERQTAVLGRDVRSLRQRHEAATLPSRSALQIAADLGLSLDDWQRDVVTSDPALDVLMLVSRQGGKGVAATVLALAKLLGDPGSKTLVISRSERQAKRLFRRIRRAYHALPRTPPALTDTGTELELRTGSELLALPGSEATVRGLEAVDLALVDEAARVPDDLMEAVRPMLATTNGRLVALTTPFGARGWFHRAWSEGGPDWVRVIVPATRIPRISPAFLAKERRRLGDQVYAQEYACRFIDAVGQVFGGEFIARALADDLAPLFADAALDAWDGDEEDPDPCDSASPDATPPPSSWLDRALHPLPLF